MKNIILLISAFFISNLLNASTIVVTNTNDAGAGSFRQATISAAPNDTIRFDPTLISSGNAVITLNSQIPLTKNLVIKGLYNSTDSLIISGYGLSVAYGLNIDNTLDSMVFANGFGAIYNEGIGTLTVLNSIFRNNNSFSYSGAAIYMNSAALLDVDNSVFIANYASSGGAIYTYMTPLHISNSVFERNDSDAGGAIAIHGNSSTLSSTIDSSFFISNFSYDGFGGAIFTEDAIEVNQCYFESNNGELGGYGGAIYSSYNLPHSISYSTFNSNVATRGGALYLNGGNLSHCTFVDNIAYGLGSVLYSTSGVTTFTNSSIVNTINTAFFTQASATVNLGGSILVGSSGANAQYNTINSLGYNILSGPPTGGQATDIFGLSIADVNLGPLQNNGGYTQTMLPLIPSVAIDMGDPSDMSDAQNRPIVGGIRDIGAAESCASASSDTLIACGSYTWANGDGLTYTQDTIVQYILSVPNSIGCDSILILDLTVNPSPLDQSISAVVSPFCDNGNAQIQGMAEVGVVYSLYENGTSNLLDGPQLGNSGLFDLFSGNINTTTNFGVEAAYVGAPWNSLNFATGGTSQYVDLGNPITSYLAGSNQITVEAWVNTNATTNLQTIVSNYESNMQFLLRLDNNIPTFYVDGGAGYVSTQASTTLSTNTWYHVAGTWDGYSLRIYVNGVLESSHPLLGTFPAITNNVKIGGGLSNNTEFFSGDITGVRIWEDERTQAEISAGMNDCVYGFEDDLLAAFYMADGPGSFGIQDMTSNGYNGTLINMDPNTDFVSNIPNSITCTSCSVQMTDIETVIVNYSDLITDNITACDSITWIDGVTYTSSNSTATMSYTNLAGCDSTINLNLTIVPNISLTATSTDEMFGNDGSIDLTVNGGSGNFTFDWDNDGTGDNDDTEDLSGITAGNYTVVVMDDAGCSDTLSQLVGSQVGIGDINGISATIYPNPSNGAFFIELGSVVDDLQIEILDMQGKIVYNRNYSNTNIIRIDEDLPAGSYTIKVSTDSDIISIMMIHN